jgi:hypothetical protein
MGLNRRETYVVGRMDAAKDRMERRAKMRDRALDLVAAAMGDVIDPAERQDLARELCTATAMNASQACGPSSTGTHLASLSGQAFGAAEKIQQLSKRRAAGCTL